MTLVVDDKRKLVTVTITSGATGLSDAVDLGGYWVAAIDMSTGWTAASLSFQACNTSGGTFVDLYDQNGIEWTATSTASRAVSVDSDLATALYGHRWLKVRSGTTTGVVAQTTTRTLYLVATPA